MLREIVLYILYGAMALYLAFIGYIAIVLKIRNNKAKRKHRRR